MESYLAPVVYYVTFGFWLTLLTTLDKNGLGGLFSTRQAFRVVLLSCFVATTLALLFSLVSGLFMAFYGQVGVIGLSSLVLHCIGIVSLVIISALLFTQRIKSLSVIK